MKVQNLRTQYKKLVMVFTLFLFVFSKLSAQPNPSLIDSTIVDTIVAVDSFQVSDVELVKPRWGYILIDPDRPNLKLDSLIEKITVRDNNFIAWVDFANSITKKKDLVSSPTKVTRPSWVLGVLSFLLIALGIVRFFFYPTFISIVYGLFSERAQISKEDGVLTSWPYIFLYIIFSFSVGLFISLYQFSTSGSEYATFLNFLKISGAVALLFVAKILFVRFLAVIFEVDKLAKEYISILYLLCFNSILVLIPFLIFISFSTLIYFKIIVILFVLLFSIAFLFKLFKQGSVLFGGQKFSIFYLILYLCALEIAPILILAKTLSY